MVYSKARLDHALRVFRQFESGRHLGNLPRAHIYRLLEHKYSLRNRHLTPRPANVWQDKEDERGSDDEEYDPSEERKKLNGKKKSRKADQKRKAEDSGDQERIAKKTIGDDEINAGDGTAYVTLSLTSDKAKQLLIDLAPGLSAGRGSSELRRNLREREPSYWRNHGTGSGSSRRDSGVGWDLENDVTVTDVDQEHDKEVAACRSSLRNGKILERKALVTKSKSLKQDDNVTEDHDRKIVTNSRCAVSLRGLFDPIRYGNRSMDQIGSLDQPIELDESEDEPTSQSTQDFETHNIRVKEEAPEEYSPAALSPDPDFASKQTKHALSFRDESGLTTIETSYAHPINFCHLPQPGQPCDFCADWRMGVIGLGKRYVSVFVEPGNSNDFQEIGDGHRNTGHLPTRMCVSCALDRLLIMRCHSADDGNTFKELALPTSPMIARIAGVKYNSQRLKGYLQQLFGHPSDDVGSDNKRKKSPLPICSLCPAPASWQCCKWQKADKMKRPCSMPATSVATPAVTSTSAIISLSSSSPATPPRARSMISQNNVSPGRRISIVSLDDDDDEPTQVNSEPNTTPIPAFVKPSVPLLPARAPSLTNSMNSSSTQSSGRTRGPLRGCGLKFCTDCKTFVEKDCDGVLERKKILKMLRTSEKKHRRADVEFLFEGSALHRSYASKQKKY